MDFVNKKLDEFENYIRGKRVAIIGLGVSNIPLIDYFHNLGASAAFFDKRPVEKLDKEAVQKIHNYNFDLYLGENNWNYRKWWKNYYYKFNLWNYKTKWKEMLLRWKYRITIVYKS